MPCSKLTYQSFAILCAISLGGAACTAFEEQSAIGGEANRWITVYNASETNYSDEHKPLVDAAIELFAARNNVSSNQLRNGRAVVLLQNAQEVCILLALDPPVPGGEPIYCFDRRSKQLTHRADDVE